MQRWEYQTASLFPVFGFVSNKGWKLKTINEKELPSWKSAEKLASVASFCNEMGQQGWELVSAATFGANMELFLCFKRPRE